MQAVMETIFSVLYLIIVITLGSIIVLRSKNNFQYRLFGIMTLILGCGDAFHLVPRIIAFWTTGLDNYTVALGIGKLITSISMTIFYVVLFHIWKMRYNIIGKKILTISIYILTVARIILCLLPQNKWAALDSPVEWGIYRNIPFVILGTIMVIVYFQTRKNDHEFRFLWLAILLSFAFYIPVVLWTDKNPLIGMLMIPKTCMYVWIVLMGFKGKGRT